MSRKRDARLAGEEEMTTTPPPPPPFDCTPECCYPSLLAICDGEGKPQFIYKNAPDGTVYRWEPSEGLFKKMLKRSLWCLLVGMKDCVIRRFRRSR